MTHVLANDLKDSIIQSAVTGKLTDQNLKDKSVFDLLNELKVSAVSNQDIEIPKNWAFVKLGSVCLIARGGSPRPIKEYITNDKNGINWIKIGDTEKTGKYIFSTKEKIKPEGVKHSRFVHEGDFLLTNSMSFGRPYILRTSGCIHDGWLVISQPKKVFNQDYLYYLLSSKYAYNQFTNMASGAVVKNLNIDKVVDSIFPLPPIEEQQRIVDKVDELMAKIDEYEKIENQLVELKKGFPTNMKDSILQAAFQGKLSKAESSDCNVDSMIIQMQDSICELIEKKVIKKEKPLDTIFDSEIPFSIPATWRWKRIGEVVDCASGSTPLKDHSEYYLNGTINWLKTGELNNSYIMKCEEKITEEAFKAGSFRLNRPGDILIAMYGATIGKLGICTFETTTNQACLGCTPYKGLYNMYLFYYFMYSKESLIGKAEGGAQPNISRIKIRNHLIPIPPIQEQQRIVDLLDKLLPLCDELESK